MITLSAAAVLAAFLAHDTAPVSTAVSSPASAADAPPTCRGVPATIVGTAGADRLVGASGPGVIAALAGEDEVRGLGDDDLLCGGPGDDTVTGGPGDDRLVAGTGSDILYGDEGDDHLRAARPGPVELFGGPGDDTLVLVLPSAPVFMVDGASGTDRVGVRSPADGPDRATWDASTGEVTTGGSLWGRIGTVDRVRFTGVISWTCRRTGQVVVRGCDR